ncbi:MAG: protein-export membrane protein SecF [Candidatus Harrisonbacteria bacterium RIFOXYA1_FULL_48_8]|uniref:Protein-export membrane protein SecF n=3 Tax=Parcubacteria group TaxID=1794811 RepID=A0A0G1T574_9BACT|nr:MAG: Protein translocase subunit SecF [Candidatus Giovannonibacteria bacterium GW2011_GWB1_47_6b]OGY64476.1 MAG: protein-export membrane protein SecF [Candidatus Harrisonbacteria bacterium RIFCSPHIGHO2_12_FULL_48_16]OGY68454.1 MAG: protein-export membrane protein SecF [Candidatus Harrisonbacteria bacterium RIFOXYA1_FULL_48_8]
MLPIIKNKFIFLTLSGVLVLASIVAIWQFGLTPGIDFAGGVSWQLQFASAPDRAELQNFFPEGLITPGDNGDIMIRLKNLTDQEKAQKLTELSAKFGAVEELQFQNIGPAVGNDLRRKAIWAFALVLVTISLYVAFAFRKVSQPVSSWKYGVITLVTLFHDTLIPAGMFAVLGYLFHVEVDTNFIVAILVVMGFSVHDTIVVFDRIRENLRIEGGVRADFNQLVNKSVNQTLARSVNTSLTLVLTLLALYFLGPITLQYFILTILVGTVVGTYSSIFVASPLLTLWR